MKPTVTLHLPEALNAWGTPGFDTALKAEIARLDPAALPLQEALSQGSYALGDELGVILLGTEADRGAIRAKVGLQYRSVIAGCSCADDPTPLDTVNEYCEIVFEIDTRTAAATLALVSQD